MSTLIELERFPGVTLTCSNCHRTSPADNFYFWKDEWLENRGCKSCARSSVPWERVNNVDASDEVFLTDEVLPSWKEDTQRRGRRIREAREQYKMTRIDKKISNQRRRELKEYTVCFYCGETDIKPEIEHFFPLSKGGTNHAYNLVASCEDCNAMKFMNCGTWMLLVIGEKNV